MNIAIIDDSREDACHLLSLITDYCSEAHLHQTTAIYNHTEDFLRVWKPGTVQMVFIDIYFQNDPQGIALAEEIRGQDSLCAIVFTTVSSDFALKGYEVRALDYLVKPIDRNSLCRAMNSYRSLAPWDQKPYIEVKESRIMIKIAVDDIIYTDYSNHYIQIHLVDKLIRTYMRFNEFSGLLLCYPQFLKCYRNCLINMNKVTALQKSGFIVITGEHLPITRNLRPQIHQQYADYQFRRLNGGIG